MPPPPRCFLHAKRAIGVQQQQSNAVAAMPNKNLKRIKMEPGVGEMEEEEEDAAADEHAQQASSSSSHRCMGGLTRTDPRCRKCDRKLCR
jgi:hypothetical protein